MSPTTRFTLLVAFAFVAIAHVVLACEDPVKPPVTPPVTPPSTPSNIKAIVPAYFSPGTAWNAFATASAAKMTHAIIANPASGPGTSVNANYKTYIDKTQAAGVLVLGYVYTAGGSRCMKEVKADVDKYFSFYAVDGIFMDSSIAAAQVNYYKELNTYIRTKAAKTFIMMGPGNYYQTSAYIDLADTHLVLENTYTAYRSFSMPTWVRNYPASKFTHLVHSTSASQVNTAISLAKNRNVGYLFVTNDKNPNPYDTMPSYYSTFLSALA